MRRALESPERKRRVSSSPSLALRAFNMSNLPSKSLAGGSGFQYASGWLKALILALTDPSPAQNRTLRLISTCRGSKVARPCVP